MLKSHKFESPHQHQSQEDLFFIEPTSFIDHMFYKIVA